VTLNEGRLLRVRPNLPSLSLRPFSRHPQQPHIPGDPRSCADRWVRSLEESTSAIASAETSSSSRPSTSSVAGPSSSPPSHHQSAKRLPNFFIGSYADALKKAKDDLRLMCVILVSSEHEDHDEFVQNVIGDPEFVATLNDKDILVWGGDVRDRDAYQGWFPLWHPPFSQVRSFLTTHRTHTASQILEATTFPFVCFISLQPPRSPPGSSSYSSSAPSTAPPKMTVFSRLFGPPSSSTSPATIVTHINTILVPRTASYLSRLRQQRRVREQERAIRAEQDRAYEEAGRRDRERVLAKRREEEERIRKEQEAKEAREKQEQRRRHRMAWRARKASQLPPEPTPDSSSSQKTTRVVVRLPDGRRIVRTFYANESTEALYAFVDVEAGEKEDGPLPDGYVHQYDFVLATSFPRRIVDKSGEKTLDMVEGLVPSANLVVEGWKNGDDDDDEDEEEDEDDD
jgi:FAS-associated factor 2